jgi:hypothetical protein
MPLGWPSLDADVLCGLLDTNRPDLAAREPEDACRSITRLLTSAVGSTGVEGLARRNPGNHRQITAGRC